MTYEIYFEFGTETQDHIFVYSKAMLDRKLCEMQKSHLYKAIKYRKLYKHGFSSWIPVTPYYNERVFKEFMKITRKLFN